MSKAKTRAIELAIAIAMILAYILLQALADKLGVEMPGALRMALEALLPAGAGALLFSRPSDMAADDAPMSDGV